MKIIKIKFVGFWNDLIPENNYFTNILKKKYDVQISDDPDYLFCSVFSHEYIKYNDCIRIFFSGECQTPDFNLFDYGMGFDYIDFDDRYFRLPLYLLYDSDLLKKARMRGGMITDTYYRNKFCSFVYSNKNADNEREQFYRMLSKYKTVDSGGRFLNNVGGMVENKLEFEAEHRFSIAFENSSYPGYLSEKIFQSFAAGTIPIYWGDELVCRTINRNAFVDVRSFENFDRVIEYIKYIDNDRDRFLKVLKEPIFTAGYNIDSHNKAAEEFLFHIIEQDKDRAYRRNRTFRGRNYEKFFLRYGEVNDRISGLKRYLNKRHLPKYV